MGGAVKKGERTVKKAHAKHAHGTRLQSSRECLEFQGCLNRYILLSKINVHE